MSNHMKQPDLHEAETQPEASQKQGKTKRPKMPKLCAFLMVIFALSFVATIASLIFTSRDLVSYDSATLLDWLNVVLQMAALWMIWCRFRVARPFVMCCRAFNIAVGAVRVLVTNDLTSLFANGSQVLVAVFLLVAFCLSSLYDIVLILYFWRSKKLKAYLTEDFGVDQTAALGEYKGVQTNYRSWAFWRNIAIYYCFFSLAGHWMEFGFCWLIRLGLVQGEVDLNNTMLWRDWFYPFPMEGLAVVVIAVALYPLFAKLREKISIPGVAYLVSFIINGLVCVSIEYTMGMFVNADLHLWDYSNMPFNLNGMICLQNGLGFAAASSIICWIVYPLLDRLLSRVPKNVMNLVFVITLSAYAIPQALYLIDPPVPYRVEIENALSNPNLDATTREFYQGELDKLNQLESQGVELAGASETKK